MDQDRRDKPSLVHQRNKSNNILAGVGSNDKNMIQDYDKVAAMSSITNANIENGKSPRKRRVLPQKTPKSTVVALNKKFDK